MFYILFDKKLKIKILQGADEDPVDHIVIQVPSLPTNEGIQNESSTNELQLSAQDVIMQHETEKTKLLTDEQLKRLVLLEQLKVLELQSKKLERYLQPRGNDINFQLIGFNENNPTDLMDIQ